MKKWETLSSTPALDTPWFKVRQDKVRLPNGKILDDYFVWEEEDVAMIVPVTTNHEFVLVKQYKHGVDTEVIEFPAGYLNKDEEAGASATRELLEETGYSGGDISQIGKLTTSPSKNKGQLYVYLAKELQKKENPTPDETESIEIITLSYDKVQELILQGEIWASSTIAAFYIACKKMGLTQASL